MAQNFLKIRSHLSIVLLLICAGNVTAAQATWYQVEVIVFEYLNPHTDGEIWYKNPGLPDLEGSIDLITAMADGNAGISEALPVTSATAVADTNTSPLTAYLTLPAAHHHLDDIFRVLKLSRNYRPVYHIAWQQPGLEQGEVRFVHLQKTEKLFEEEQDLPDELADIQIKEADYVPERPVFDGVIRLRSSRFLHLDVDFVYFPADVSILQNRSPETGAMSVTQQADYVRLKESRKIILNELHYFDHPFFGIIVQVSRL